MSVKNFLIFSDKYLHSWHHLPSKLPKQREITHLLMAMGSTCNSWYLRHPSWNGKSKQDYVPYEIESDAKNFTLDLKWPINEKSTILNQFCWYSGHKTYSWVGHFHKVSWGLVQYCEIFINRLFLSQCKIFCIRPYFGPPVKLVDFFRGPKLSEEDQSRNSELDNIRNTNQSFENPEEQVTVTINSITCDHNPITKNPSHSRLTYRWFKVNLQWFSFMYRWRRWFWRYLNL